MAGGPAAVPTVYMTKPMVCSWAPWGRVCLQFFCIRAIMQVQMISSSSSKSSSSSGRQILNWGLVQNVSVEGAGQDGSALPRVPRLPSHMPASSAEPVGSSGPLTSWWTLTPVTLGPRQGCVGSQWPHPGSLHPPRWVLQPPAVLPLRQLPS